MTAPSLNVLTSKDIEQGFLEHLTLVLVRVVKGMATLLQQAAPVLFRMAQTIEQLEKLPPVKGYEAFFIEEGRHPLEARFMALVTIKLGADLRQQRLAERSLTSAIGRLAKVEGAGSLVISRRAKHVACALNEPLVEVPLENARTLAGVSESIDSLKELVSRAMDRDAAACRRLTEISMALRSHLRDPRGRIPSVASTTHELLLHWHKGAYTYDAYAGDMTDSATRATRVAMNALDFDPRPARRLQRARQSR
jgi:hypothetical protein